MLNKLDEKAVQKFYKAVMSFDSLEDCRDFFDDIFTIQEMQAISQRLEVACLLSEGKSYVDVSVRVYGAKKAKTVKWSRILRR